MLKNLKNCPGCQCPINQLVLDVKMTISFFISSDGAVGSLRESMEDLKERTTEGELETAHLYCEQCDAYYTVCLQDDGTLSIGEVSGFAPSIQPLDNK